MIGSKDNSTVESITPYTITRTTTVTELFASTASFYRALTIENYTDQMLYAMFPDGEIRELPPYPNVLATERRCIFSVFTREGAEEIMPNQMYTCNSRKYPIDKYSVSLKAMTIDAIYIKELGIAVATAGTQERLKMVHLLHQERFDTITKELIEDYFKNNWPVVTALVVNCHNPNIEYMYININGSVGSVKVRHDYNELECAKVYLNRGGSHLVITFDYDFASNGISTQNVAGVPWSISTSRDKIGGLIEADSLNRSKLLSWSETEQRLKSGTEDLKKENEQLKAELTSVKKELVLAQAELNRANEIGKLTTEQQMQTLKLQTAIEEKIALTERKQQAYEQTIMKNEADLQVARAKVDKERLSITSAEVSNTGAFAKAAAVILPLAVSAAIYISKATSGLTSIGAGVGSVLVTGGAGLTIGLGTACLGRNIISGATKVIKSTCTRVGNVICNVASSAWKCTKRLFSWLF